MKKHLERRHGGTHGKAKKKDRSSSQGRPFARKEGAVVIAAHLLVSAIDAVARLRKNATEEVMRGNQEVLTLSCNHGQGWPQGLKADI